MTEQEIITYLKENRKRGVAFAFMSSEVQEWCRKHFSERIFYIVDDGAWSRKETSILCCPDSIYCIDKDYEPFKSFKSDWQEFDIDDSGCFEFEGKKYYYREDTLFETENRNKFKGFGGWLYTEGGHQIWSMTPRISVCDSDIAWSEPDIKGEHQNCSMTPRSDVAWAESDIEAKPATPIKIRFWRIKE